MNLSFFSYWVKRLKLEVEIYYIYLSRPIIIGQLFVKKKKKKEVQTIELCYLAAWYKRNLAKRRD